MATSSTEARPDGVAARLDGLLAALAYGELEVIGRLIGSSNNAMVVRVHPPAGPGRGEPASPTRAQSPSPSPLPPFEAVYKPTLGERPLFDFPAGTLGRREVAAYLVSEATGWGIVPPTVLRDGPFGEGAVQWWAHADPAVDVVAMVVADDTRLRRVALFDAIVNNTDRKGGHLVPVPGGHVYGVDHGVTFSTVPKLRTLLWAWEGEPLDGGELDVLRRVRDGLSGELGERLGELLSLAEVRATRRRVTGLLRTGRFPSPSPDWPATPWPPF